jgi:hypothetical protein
MKLKFSLNTSEIRAKLGKITSQEKRREILQTVGADIHDKVQRHIGEMSVLRHKTANRLGAEPSKHFENATGRVVLREVTAERATVVIENTPGLSRAYQDLHIQPVRARWLTIPIHRDAYNKRVADLRGMGHKIFRPGKARILAETTTRTETYTDKSGKTRKRKKLRPLYALVKSVRVPRDKGLLPQEKQIRQWAVESAKNVIDALID